MYFDLKELYAATRDGLTIFEYYFPDAAGKLTDPRHKFKIRTDEKTASAKLSYYQSLWRITDFGDQSAINGMSPVDWVMYREGLQYYDALKFISEVVLHRAPREGFRAAVRKPGYALREMTADDKPGEYRFAFRQTPTPEELKIIGRYVTPELLAEFNCRTVEQYEYCGHSDKLKRNVVHIFSATPDYPIYLFDYKTFKKLYRPMEIEKRYRFMYIGEKPKNYVFGMEQLLKTESEFNRDDEEEPDLVVAGDGSFQPNEDDTGADEPKKEKRIVKDLFRCSGETDALNLASLGFHVYWLNSESATIDAAQYADIDQYCENHYQIMDLDATGQREAERNALRHINIFNIALPVWIAARKDWRGNACKDLKDFINLSGKNKDETAYDFRVLKTNARRARFWSKTKDKQGKRSYNFSMENFYFFLRLNGFYKIAKSYVRKADYMYVKLDGKVFRLIAPDKIKSEVKEFTKRWIERKKMMNILPLLDKINTSNQITEANMEGLPEIDINFRNASRNVEYLHFANGMSMKITPAEIRMIRQDDVPNYILGALPMGNKIISHVLPHTNIRVLDRPPIEVTATPEYRALLERRDAAATPEDREAMNAELADFPELDRYMVTIHDNDFVFARFLRDMSRLHWRKEMERGEPLTDDERKEEQLALANLLFVYGYLCSEYKDPARAWVVFTMDYKISEVGNSSGRSGKSVKTWATRFVRPTFCVGGRELDNADSFKFIYDGYTEFHNNIEVDDFAEFGLFDYFYTEITGFRKINPKNYSAFDLEYRYSGKMSISTNFELKNTDASTIARILYEVASDYYHEKTDKNDYLETRKPDVKFGRQLYDDFTPDEWLKFYNLMAHCIQLPMRFYKINPPMANIVRRELRREMQAGVGKTDDFFKWANVYFRPRPESAGDIAPADEGWFNCYIVKEYAYKNFVENLSSKQRNDFRINKFKEHVEAWCRYYGYTFNPPDKFTDHQNKRIMKHIHGEMRSMECFYIVAKQDLPADTPASPPAVPALFDPDDDLPI
ncbi:MAG: hypothetical protein LBF69_00920 [Prevotellaceae bacterium]|jgi:hypothetical protein|nr:hypothetical protein [Prevotellaceae bacterium]